MLRTTPRAPMARRLGRRRLVLGLVLGLRGFLTEVLLQGAQHHDKTEAADDLSLIHISRTNGPNSLPTISVLIAICFLLNLPSPPKKGF